MFRAFISKLVSSQPRFFYFLKKLDLWIHFIFKIQFEPDFKVFSKLGIDSPLVIADIGANIGQSAVGFGAIFRLATIHSFEANPDLATYLRSCRALLGNRFSFHLVGCSDSASQLDLFIPKRKQVLIFGEATVDPHVLKDPLVRSRIGAFDVIQRKIDLVEFDSTGLKPDIVKIDVQGHELSVLKGMKRVIAKVSPIFLIERSSADDDVMELLRPHGYEFFVARETRSLVRFSADSARVNLFCLPVSVSARTKLVSALLE